MKKIYWKILIVSLILVYSIAFLGSLFVSSSVDSQWYQETKPSITPPNWVFPIVWNILFFLIAISLYLAWTNSKGKNRRKVSWVFGINFFLNLLWDSLYFGLKNPSLAFFEMILLWVSIAIMIKVTYKINKTSSYLLIPYLLWVGFALILNYLSI